MIGRTFWSKIKVATALPIFLAASIFLRYMREANSRTLPESDLEQLVAGTAATPFQYRVLIPALVRALRSVWAIIDIEWAFRVVDIGSIFTILVLMAMLLRRRGMSANWVAMGYLMLAANYGGPYLNFVCCYDMPAIAFFIAGLIVIEDRRWGLYYPLLAVSLLNRETAVLLVGAFGLLEWDRLPRRTLMMHVAAQIAIALAIKGGLWWIFLDNHGFGLASTMYVSVNDPPPTDPIPRIWLNLFWVACYGPISLFAGMWLPAAIGAWISPDKVIKRLLWIVPIDAAIMFVVGVLWEPRVFNELIPIVLISAVSGIREVVCRSDIRVSFGDSDRWALGSPKAQTQHPTLYK